ncbi:MAG: hypothetical protein LBG91_05385 [Treponema sp.]|jgi:chromosome segregation ATPase|nr:hypothetical protein [Treponema sp.]
MLDLLSAANAAASGIASLIEVSNGIKNSELQRQLAEVNRQVADIQNEAASLVARNRELQSMIEAMENEKKAPLVYNPKDGFYYDSESDIPYCPNCYEGAKKERRHLKVGFKECPNCHEAYEEAHPTGAVIHRGGGIPGYGF